MSCAKQIISRELDITVIVGSGGGEEEFQCYGVILEAASPYLGAMLNSGMREGETRHIQFPDKDPKG